MVKPAGRQARRSLSSGAIRDDARDAQEEAQAGAGQMAACNEKIQGGQPASPAAPAAAC
ncbi:MAG: hypothetical protein U0361_12175 [Nitrospiraceae bacterium]